ncbi:hypothetical protein CDL12_12616 [Handroanthus impetiginosus]|uniref:Small ribosomal subunit protein uS7 domain-containing protein n=1 Tax=Handroanthus impetiginosus TaxID=429701 RepID=A0A2G9HB59_9LAMI|nr:hypothetical protein CDL12_12616 [Handroanthus impetiginosus]
MLLMQVIVDVLNNGPREHATHIRSAGVVRRQAVDVSPCAVAHESAFRNIKTIAECLADEFINAAKGSYAIEKKDEIEKVAKANH